MAGITTLIAVLSAGWLAYLAVAIVVGTVILTAVVIRAFVLQGRIDRKRRETRLQEAKNAKAETNKPAAKVRPNGQARGRCAGWTYDLFDVDDHEDAILAVFEPYTDHSVGYLFEDHPKSQGNPLGVECAGILPHPSELLGAEKIWLHRPELKRLVNAHDYGMTQRVTLAMLKEIDFAYGDKPEGCLK